MNEVRNSRLFSKALAVLGTFAALSFVAAPKEVSAQQAQPRKVTMALPGSSAIAWYPIFVAKDKGFFKDEGLDVTVQSIDGSGPVLQAMTAGGRSSALPDPGPTSMAPPVGASSSSFITCTPAASSFWSLRRKQGSRRPRGSRAKSLASPRPTAARFHLRAVH
jgi:hypothetical protein